MPKPNDGKRFCCLIGLAQVVGCGGGGGVVCRKFITKTNQMLTDKQETVERPRTKRV